MGLGTEKGLGVLPTAGSTSLEGPLDDKCVLVPGRGRRCPVDIPAARGTQPVRNRAGPRGLLNAGEKRTGAPHGEWDLQLPGSSVPPRGSRPPPHYLLPGTRWTAVSPFKSPKGGRHLPLCVLLLWPSPSPPPTAVAPRTDRNRRPGAWREALDLPAAGAGCSGCCRRDAGPGGGEVGAALEWSHQALALQQRASQPALPDSGLPGAQLHGLGAVSAAGGTSLVP